MQDFEKLGVFYLGKRYDPSSGQATEDLHLLESKDLTTHAICVGMTGSGKTGLGIALLEEAGIDQVPALIVDPKGDLTNLLLTFPSLAPQDFFPWVDAGEAERKGLQPQAYAEQVAATWKKGLANWGEGGPRIQKFKDAVETVIYTPASQAGIPLSILSSFAAPSKELMLDATALRDRIVSLTSSLLSLLGIEADPIQSREHILISTLINDAWSKGQNLDLPSLIQLVQKPPFAKLGVLDIDTFYPSKERMALSISLNNLLASPGFQAWMEGEPLDIQKILYTDTGKPKQAILYIAHLSNAERMFFVTLVLNELVAWMRRQPGTSSLRALFYMDEIFGFFPPTAMPPSKTPMLTLLKQARAFGLGVVLATQNPVDLDYKGLANCGTWFIGKLQTERDKARVIEGLNSASNGELDAATLDQMIASTGNRKFLMRSIYQKDPVLFETRWTLSYLRGPLTLVQVSELEKPEKKTAPVAAAIVQTSRAKPIVAAGFPEFYLNKTRTANVKYQPRILGAAQLHFVDSKNKVNTWQEVCLVAAIDADGRTIRWAQAENVPEILNYLENAPLPESTFAELSSGWLVEKNLPSIQKDFADALYQTQKYTLFQAPDFGQTSNAGESEAEFRTRVALLQREKRDGAAQKLREKYESKMAALMEKARKAKEKMEAKQQKATMQKAETLLSFGTTLLGAFLGKGVTKGTVSQAGSSLKRAGKISQDSQDATQAQQEYDSYEQQLEDLRAQLNQEIAASSSLSPDAIKIETVEIYPKKSDISIKKFALVWVPLHT